MRYSESDEPSFLERNRGGGDDIFTKKREFSNPGFSRPDNPVRDMLNSSPQTREEQEMTRRKYMQQSDGFMNGSPHRRNQMHQTQSSYKFYIIIIIAILIVVVILILYYVFSSRKPNPNASNGYGNAPPPPPGYYDPRSYPPPQYNQQHGRHPPRRSAPPQEMNQAINNRFPPNQPGPAQSREKTQHQNESEDDAMNIVNGEDEQEEQNVATKPSKNNRIKNDKVRRKQMRLKKMQSRDAADRDSVAMDKVKENLETDKRYRVLKKSNFKPGANNDLIGTRADNEESDPDD